MDLKKLTTDELTQLVVYISEEIEQRRREEASTSKNDQTTKQSRTPNQVILKRATLPDPTHSPPAETEDLQPAPKHLKDVVPSNRYQVLSVEDDDEDPEELDAMSDEDFPALNPSQESDSTINALQKASHLQRKLP